MVAVFNIFVFWCFLCLLAIILLYFRKDKREVFQDISKLLVNHNIFYGIFSLIVIFIVFPFTLYWSIKYFLNKFLGDDSERNY